MTKLEEEIFHAIIEDMTKPEDVKSAYSYEKYIAGVAAEVAKKYIVKAYIDSALLFSDPIKLCSKLRLSVEEVKDEWLKENGVIE